MIVIGELEGKLDRYTFAFDKSLSAYSLRKEEGVSMQDVTFTVLDRSVCVAANGDNVEIFADNQQVKIIGNSPLTGSQDLINFGNKIYVINGDSLHQLSLK